MVSASSAMAAPISAEEGGALAVRRGIAVNRNPTAKASMNDCICTLPCAVQEYVAVAPTAYRSQ
jgi:hypothetical protein